MTNKDVNYATQNNMRHTFPFSSFSMFLPLGAIDRETEDVIYRIISSHRFLYIENTLSTLKV